MGMRETVKRCVANPKQSNEACYKALKQHVTDLIAEQPHNMLRLQNLLTWADKKLA